MLGRIIGGLLMSAIGGACCYYAYPLVQAFGRNARAERNLGGTRNAVVLFGMLFVVLGVLIMFGVFSISNPTDQIPSGFVSESSQE